MSTSTPNDCPFNKVPLEIAFNILEYCDLKTRKSLALSCRKWYETLLALPESKRCFVREYQVKWEPDGLMCSNSMCSIDIDIARQMICTPQTKFNLVRNLKIIILRISPHYSDETGKFRVMELFKFLDENRSRIKIDMMFIKEPLNESDFRLLDSIVDMAKSINIKFGKENKNSSEYLQSYKKMVDTLIKKHLTHNTIFARKIGEIETITTILQQWARGERPNLKSFRCGLPTIANDYDRETFEGLANNIVAGLDYVSEIINLGTEERADLVFAVSMPDIGRMKLRIYRRTFTMRLLH